MQIWTIADLSKVLRSSHTSSCPPHFIPESEDRRQSLDLPLQEETTSQAWHLSQTTHPSGGHFCPISKFSVSQRGLYMSAHRHSPQRPSISESKPVLSGTEELPRAAESLQGSHSRPSLTVSLLAWGPQARTLAHPLPQSRPLAIVPSVYRMPFLPGPRHRNGGWAPPFTPEHWPPGDPLRTTDHTPQVIGQHSRLVSVLDFGTG